MSHDEAYEEMRRQYIAKNSDASQDAKRQYRNVRKRVMKDLNAKRSRSTRRLTA